jgi:hypothetical protein
MCCLFQQCCGSRSVRIHIIFQNPLPGVVGSLSGFVSYSNEHNKINWKGKLTKYNMPSGLILLDLLTRKIELRCIKSTVSGSLPLWNGKDPDPYQTVGSGSVSNLKAWSGSVPKLKANLDPYQKGLDLQHCFPVLSTGRRSSMYYWIIASVTFPLQ